VKLKAKIESRISYVSFKRLVPGAFNSDFIGSIGTALPWTQLAELHVRADAGRGVAAQVGIESKC
jgi:hypothetical protein